MQLYTHKFPSGVDEEMVMLTPSLLTISSKIGANIEIWEEDGWGMTRGFFGSYQMIVPSYYAM